MEASGASRAATTSADKENEGEESFSLLATTSQNVDEKTSGKDKNTQDMEGTGTDSKRNWCMELLSEMNCMLDTEDKQQDPFSKRRLFFVFVVSVVAVVVNLVVIPISLTRMDDRNSQTETQTPITSASVNPTQLLAPTTSPLPSSSPSLAPTLQPTFFGQTIRPTQSPVTNPPSSPDFTAAPSLPLAALTPTAAPAAIAIALPPYTLAALNDINSPQSKAFQWLTSDPNFNTYNSFRTLQRMALATFFFSTNEAPPSYKYNTAGAVITTTAAATTTSTNSMQNGLDPEVFSNLFSDSTGVANSVWVNATNWMSYDVHECFWFSNAPYVCDAQQSYRYLTIQNNGLSGRLPLELGLLTTLVQIQLSDNILIYGSIPSTFGFLTQLVTLQLSNLPQLSGTIPTQIQNLHNSLKGIDLRETPFFQKVLPTEMGLLTRLEQLRLETHTNRGSGVTTITGTLPTELGNMKSLVSFTISGNELIGQLPQQLANLSFLEWMHITETQIGGSIPPQFGYMQSLANLQLGHNRLSQTLPVELALLSRTLTNLEINDNLVTGTIPFQYSNLTRCTAMSFQKNMLEGTVPLGLCYLRTNNVIQNLRVDCDFGSASSYRVACSCDCECF